MLSLESHRWMKVFSLNRSHSKENYRSNLSLACWLPLLLNLSSQRGQCHGYWIIISKEMLVKDMAEWRFFSMLWHNILPNQHPLQQCINDDGHDVPSQQWNVLKIESDMYQGCRDEQQHSAKSPRLFCSYCKAIEQLVTCRSDEPAQIGFDHVDNFPESIKLRGSFNMFTPSM